MSTGRHSLQTVTDGIHISHAYEYANAAARTGASGFITGDIGKLAKQTDTLAWWVLVDTSPTWKELTPSAVSIAHSSTTGQTADDHHNQVHDLAGSDHNASTLANLNLKISDATLIDTADSRLSDARTPVAHDLGGVEHNADTLANLNLKISDATLDDSGDSRAPTAHNTSHQSGGSDAIKLDDLAAPDDNTDLNVSTSAHGLTPKLSNVATQYLDGTGSYSVPAGGGGGGAADDLNSATTVVNVSGATAPTANQVLTATSSTAATWQAVPAASSTDALNSATTTIDVSAATAPTANQVLTATSSTTATWQTSAASSPDNEASTGLITGGIISIGTPNTTFTLTDGSGAIADHTTTPGTPTLTDVSWTGKTNISITNISTHIITFVSINSSGNVVQRTAALTPAERRDEVYLGVAVHVDKTIMNTQNQEQAVVFNATAQIHDLAKAIGFFNVSGNVISASGADLTIDKSLGSLFFIGSNYSVNAKDPHNLTLAAITDASFQYRFQDGTNGTTDTTLDPDIWDVGGTSTAVANNKWTVQRVYCFLSNAVKIQPGQVEYSSLGAAREGITIDDFVTEPSIAANGLLRGFIVVKKGTTDLSDTSLCQFVKAEKFGTSTGSGGGSISSLQDVYNNSNTPEIVLNATNGALTIQTPTSPTGNFIEFRDSGGTTLSSIDVAGIIKMAQFTTVGLPSAALYEGSQVYDTTTQTMKYSNGTNWIAL